MSQKELPDRFYFCASQARKLGDVLKELSKEAGLAKAFKHREILNNWRDVIGEEGYKHTCVVELKRGRLSIGVDSAALLHHLANFCKDDVLRELQARCKSAFIENIRFKLSTESKG